jgi:1-acyl-sn-glycerol-3-phosphate acyltransferase
MQPIHDRTYPWVIRAAKVGFRLLGQRFDIVGAEHIPTSGPALLACNHISYLDFIYAGYTVLPVGRKVRFMAKEELFRHRLSGPVMRSMFHIPVDRGAGTASVRSAISYLEAGEVVGIFPEATISRALEVKEIKSGAVRIAAEAQAPLIPMVLWGTQRIYTKDHPWDFTRGRTIVARIGEPLNCSLEDIPAQTSVLKGHLSQLLKQAISDYPEDGADAWWQPSSFGGSAPTLTQAAELDHAERMRRLEQAKRKRRK